MTDTERGSASVSGLHTAIRNALLFTADDSDRWLDRVRIEFGPDCARAIGCDGQVLGVTRIEYHGAEFSVDLAKRDARFLSSVARSEHHQARAAAVSIRRDGKETWLEVEFPSGEIASVPVLSHSGVLSGWRRMLPDSVEPQGIDLGLALSPTLMGRFAKVRCGSDDTLVAYPVSGGPAPKPMVLRGGDDFVGLILVGKRPESAPYSLPDWVGVGG